MHLSDLHFGRERPEPVNGLIRILREEPPDLVVISGDLTQRARASQFRAARQFLRQIPVPWLSVPGNHDVPLYNLAARFGWPLAGYRRHIHPRTDLGWLGKGVAVFGLNTTGPLSWNKGTIKPHQIRLAHEFFSSVPSKWMRILVAHHPLLQCDVEMAQERLVKCEARLKAFRTAGVDVILSGHLHRSSARLLPTGNEGTRSPLLILAGTAVSERERGEVNSYNEIEVPTHGVIQLRVRAWNGREFIVGPWTEHRVRPLAEEMAASAPSSRELELSPEA